MYLVEDLVRRYGEALGLELIAGKEGVRRRIRVPEAHRPGLGLTGYLKGHAGKRIIILGKIEVEYLRELDEEERIKRLRAILMVMTPAVIVARRYRPPKGLVTLCEELNIPLFRASMTTMNLLSKLTLLLTEELLRV